MKFAIATLIRDIDDAIALANSVRLFSRAALIGMTSLQDDRINQLYDHVVQRNKVGYWDILGLDTYDRILWIYPGTILTSHVDTLFNLSVPAMIKGGPVLIQPNKFAMDGFISEKGANSLNNEDALVSFYKQHGYKWTKIPESYISRIQLLPEQSRKSSHIWKALLLNIYLPTSTGLHDFLHSFLEPIFGTKTTRVIDANFPIYQQAFVHKSISSSNYELLEAYGDKFLKGQFIWILVNTPGIIKADQVDKISNYFQDRDRLRILCQQNGLSQYIVVQSGVNLGDKIESDVFEAFIGAIGLSWDNTLNKGDWAMHKFVTAMYQQFDIDPVNYLEKHTTPKNLVYSLVQQLQLDRDLVSNIVTAKKNEAINYPILSKDINGMVVAIVSYGNQVIGVGETSTKDKYPDVYNKEALNEAYRNVLQSRSLYNLIE